MESAIWLHGQYPVAVLFWFAVPAALAAFGAAWWASRPGRSMAARVAALLVALGMQLGLFVATGQHVPILESVAPESYCFGQPGALHYLGLLLPAAAAALAAVLGRA